jgi:hypothetical protein
MELNDRMHSSNSGNESNSKKATGGSDKWKRIIIGPHGDDTKQADKTRAYFAIKLSSLVLQFAVRKLTRLECQTRDMTWMPT